MPKTLFTAFAAQHKPLIDQRLAELLQRQTVAARRFDPAYADVYQQLRQLIGRGGKRLRPLLCLLAYQGYGGPDTTDALQLAVSLELVHAFLLIHDDIIDRDLQRWGGPNITGVYFERYSPTLPVVDALHHAQSQALLAGDICLTLANQLILESQFPADIRLQATEQLQRTVQQVLAGEIAETSYSRAVTTKDQVIKMYRAKTASYCFRLPLQIGGLAAGATQSSLADLAAVADDIGIAFQLQDDLLGVFGDQIMTGKSNQGDLREGRQTVLIITALESAAPAQRHRLQQILGDNEASINDLQIARQIIIDSGARSEVETLIKEYSDTARNRLVKTGLTADARALLDDLIAQLIDRQT